MPGIPTYTSTSHLALPPTSAAFWLYISSPIISRSLQTILSASTSNLTRRSSVSSITTCLAQFQHVIGSILSSADPDSIEYFNRFLEEDLYLDVSKIEYRRNAMLSSLKECLLAVLKEHEGSSRRSRSFKGRYLHPAVREARDLLSQMDDEDTREEISMFQRGIIKRRQSGLSSTPSNFLESEEHTLRLEFVAFKRDHEGPHGRSPYQTPRLICPALIQSLRIYHDGGLSVDSKHAFDPQSRSSSPTIGSIRGRDSAYSSTRSSNLSFLEQQFVDALSPSATSHRSSSFFPPTSNKIDKSNRRRSVASHPDFELSLSPPQKKRENLRFSPKFWWGDWESEDEDEFYREALRYDLKW